MTRPWSPQEVEERLHSAVDKLDDAVLEFKGCAEKAGRSKAHYEVGMAKALLTSRVKNRYESGKDWPVGMHEAWALVECEELRMDMEMASAHFAAQRQVLETLRTQCEVLRTLLVQARSTQDVSYRTR